MNSARRSLALLVLTPALLTLHVTTASSQVPTAYDYTSIKPPNQKVPRFLEGSQDTIAAAHITLIDLITIEYPYSPDKIIGLTPEQRNLRFDVVSKIDPPGVADPEHNPHAYQFMVDALLKNHFRLVVHENDKPFEQLLLISSGAKLAPCPSATSDNSDHPPTTCISMDEFATRLSNELNIQVVNKTNLPGTFAIGFYWSGPTVPPTARGAIPRLPQNLRTTLQTNLGLTLVPGQYQNKVLVIDHVEFPEIIELTKASTDSQ